VIQLSEALLHHRAGPTPDDPPACVPRTAPGGRAGSEKLQLSVGSRPSLKSSKSRSQQHLLAICDRKALNEALTDALMRIWRRQRLQRACPELGARFSECGYATLVGRAERDEGLRKARRRLDISAACCGTH